MRQSNNLIPNIHQLITMHYGENYWFNGCAKYVMECLGEPDYDYWFFAGLTGDNFAQIYSFDFFRGFCVSDYILSSGNVKYFEDVFKKCGYAATFVTEEQLKTNREMYKQTLISYIDKGVPVIRRYQQTWGVFVGYEGSGNTLLFLTSDSKEPEAVSICDAMPDENSGSQTWVNGWIFVGEKKEQKELKQIYRDVIVNLPELLMTKTNQYCFGAEAFRAWADEIESGKYDRMKLEEFDEWTMYDNYICNLATNDSCVYHILEKTQQLNPDFTFIKEIEDLYREMGRMRINQNGEDLEALGGGFNITLTVLQDHEKRAKIAAKLRGLAACGDEIVWILNKNLKSF